MLNLVWPLFRLGGVLWGRLLPLSLPSPLPCPGRGMRDLEGLSTDVPCGTEAAPGGWWKLSPCLTLQSSLSWLMSLNCLLSVSCLPACLYACTQQCLCCSSVIWTPPASSPQWTWTEASLAPVNSRRDHIWSRESRVKYAWKLAFLKIVKKGLLVTVTKNTSHCLCQDFFASTNHTHCCIYWLSCYFVLLWLCFQKCMILVSMHL